MTRPPASPAAPAAGRTPRSTTLPASSSSPRSARNSKSPSPPTATPAARGSGARCLPSSPRRAPNARSASGTPGRRPPGRSWRVSSKPCTGRSATRSSRSRSAPGEDPARTGEGARPGPPVQGGRPRDPGHPHRPRAQTPRQERGRADDAVRRASARRHPARTPHRTAHRDLQPQRHGRHVFAVLAVAGQIERNYIREKTLEGQASPRPRATTADARRSSTTTCSPSPSRSRTKGVPVPEIAKKLIIKTGKNAGKSPSVASLYRALADRSANAYMLARTCASWRNSQALSAGRDVESGPRSRCG